MTTTRSTLFNFQVGKPFFLSGHILQHSLEEGRLYGCEISDITNGVIQGTGFILRHFGEPINILNAFNFIDNVCKEVERTVLPQEFLRLIDEVSVKLY